MTTVQQACCTDIGSAHSTTEVTVSHAVSHAVEEEAAFHTKVVIWHSETIDDPSSEAGEAEGDEDPDASPPPKQGKTVEELQGDHPPQEQAIAIQQMFFTTRYFPEEW